MHNQFTITPINNGFLLYTPPAPVQAPNFLGGGMEGLGQMMKGMKKVMQSDPILDQIHEQNEEKEVDQGKKPKLDDLKDKNLMYFKTLKEVFNFLSVTLDTD